MIGFFGGTFDPVHNGHINLAIELKEKGQLDEVWFCPASASPFKKENDTASGLDRLEMLRLALKDIPYFKILDNEIIRGGHSYTIDTLKSLIQETGKKFRLILGEDQIQSFSSWKDFETLIKIARPLVGGRSIENSKLINSEDFEFVRIPLFDISATSVRLRVKNNLYIKHLVSAEVENYILNKGLYRNAKNKSIR